MAFIKEFRRLISKLLPGAVSGRRLSVLLSGRVLAVVAAAVILAVSCVFDTPKSEKQGAAEGQLPLSERLSIEDARAFFDDYAADFTILSTGGTRSGGDDIPPAEILWSEAIYSEFLGYEVIEVPLGGLEVASYGTDSPEAQNTPEGSMPPVNAAVQLIAGLNGYDEICYRIVLIVPDPEFLKRKGLEAADVDLWDTSDNYSGRLELFEITGEFVKGFVVSGGEVIKFISPKRNDNGHGGEQTRAGGSSGTRAIGPCHLGITKIYLSYTYDTDTQGTVNWEDGSPANGGLPGAGIRSVVFEIVTLECEDDHVGSGGGGGGTDPFPPDPPAGGGGGITPPSDPICPECGRKESQCECCDICGKYPCECCPVLGTYPCRCSELDDTVDMDDKSDEEFRDDILNIMGDCFGGRMMQDIESRNVRIKHDPGLISNALSSSSGLIRWRSVEGPQITILEELFHQSQFKHASGLLAGNRELEAKIAVYLYAMQNGLEYWMRTPFWRDVGKYINDPTEGNFNELCGALWNAGYSPNSFPTNFSSFNTNTYDLLTEGC